VLKPSKCLWLLSCTQDPLRPAVTLHYMLVPKLLVIRHHTCAVHPSPPATRLSLVASTGQDTVSDLDNITDYFSLRRDFGLLPRCRRDPRSSGVLRSVEW
jgi:hypothetical protein